MDHHSIMTDEFGRSFSVLPESRSSRYAHLYTQRRNTGKNVHCMLVTLSLVLSICSVGMASWSIYLMSSSHDMEEMGDICVPCNKLKLSPFPDENRNYRLLDKVTRSGILICCASSPPQNEALFTLVAERKVKELDISSKNNASINSSFKESPISAHVLMSGDNGDHPNRKAGGLMSVTLMPDRSLSHLQGVSLTHNRIIIEKMGSYYLYSQIYFKVVYNTNFFSTSDVLTHKVKRFRNYMNDVILLESMYSITLKHPVKDHDFRSSYVSGIFSLNAGDEIYTMVTNTSLLARDPTTNFIGLFLLGS